MAALNPSNARESGEQAGNRAKRSPFNILMAYDGSDEARAAVALVEDRFKPCSDDLSCRLSLMTVLPTQYFGEHGTFEKSLSEQSHHVEALGIRAEIVLKTGNPAPSLIAHAEEIGANLIVMGATGLRSTLGILLGGVAQQVVEHANIPILIVRSPYEGLRRVLVVVDGSESSLKALEYLAPHCQEPPHSRDARIHGDQVSVVESGTDRLRCSWLPVDCQISLMHVMQAELPPEFAARAWTLGPEVLYPAPLSPIDIAEMQRREAELARAMLKDFSGLLNTAGLTNEIILKRGDAATEILEVARQQHSDLIVCGSRGLNSVSSWLLGSVSRKLVHYAPCSVLVVK